MGKHAKLRDKILSGTADANIEFKGLCQLLIRLGFEERIRGSHHIYTHERIAEILNFQPKGRLAKPYQVRQLRNILLAYRLGETDVD